MNRKTLIALGLVLAAIAICSFVTQNVVAQAKPDAKPEVKKDEPKKEPPKAEPKKDEPKKEAPKPEPKKDEPKADAGKEVTLTGKIGDLHCFAMGVKEDAAKTTECIKAGTPVILDTGKEVYILGAAPKGTDVAAMAGQDVEVKGKLFEKAGMKFVVVTAIAKKGAEAKKEEPKKDAPKPEPKKDEPKKDAPKPEPKKDEPKKDAPKPPPVK